MAVLPMVVVAVIYLVHLVLQYPSYNSIRAVLPVTYALTSTRRVARSPASVTKASTNDTVSAVSGFQCLLRSRLLSDADEKLNSKQLFTKISNRPARKKNQWLQFGASTVLSSSRRIKLKF